ncbi:hypothetical protein Tco_0866467 [Tanacetum coccineum]
MSTQQDIYAAGSENHPPMLNKDNYVPWSSCLIRYAKSKPNGKLLMNSIKYGSYVRRIVHEPGDPNGTVLMGLLEDIYAAVDSCQTAKEIWLRVEQMMKGSTIEAQEKKAKLFNEWEKFKSTEGESIESYYHRFSKAERLAKSHDPLALMAQSRNPYNNLVFHQDYSSQITNIQHSLPNNNFNLQPSFNQNYMQQPMPNPKDISDPTTVMNMALVLIAKAFKLNYSTPTNNNLRISLNPRNSQIAQPGNQDRYNASQNVGNQVVLNAVQNPGVQNVGNQNNGNGNVVAARAEGNVNGNNGNQIRCYKSTSAEDWEEAGIQLQAEEYYLMAAAGNIDEIEEVNANCILMANLQQGSTSGIQIGKAPIYDSDGLSKVLHS